MRTGREYPPTARRIGWFLLAAASFLRGVPLYTPQAKMPPAIHWREMEQGSFIVIFPAGYEQSAAFVLERSQIIYQRLLRMWNHPVAGKTRIVLSDCSDEANGTATFFPFNQINISLIPPDPTSTIGSYHNWLDMVLCHELAHILTLNLENWSPPWLRRLFGNHPGLFPLAQLPTWAIEGLAVYAESKLEERGRLNTVDYPAMLTGFAQAGKIPSYRTLGGNPTRWPGNTAKYLFGAEFFRFLDREYGPDFIDRFLRHQSLEPVNLKTSHAFEKIYGSPLADLWERFQEESRRLAGTPPPVIDLLTDTGFNKSFPWILDNERIIFYQADYLRYPAICQLEPRLRKISRLKAVTDLSSLSVFAAEKKAYFSASDTVRSFLVTNDLYELNMRSNRVRRLSRGQRLSYPVRDTGSQELYCVQRQGPGSRLVRFHPLTGVVTPLSQPFDQITDLDLSPDGNRIAAAVKRDPREWAIALFNRSGELERFVTSGRHKSFCPRWLDSQRLFFLHESGASYRIACAELGSNRLTINQDSRIPSLRHFSFSPDGTYLVFCGLSRRGFDLGRIPTDPLSFEPLENEQGETLAPSASPASPSSPLPASRKYRPRRELAPKFWSPYYILAGNELQAGLLLTGNDATGRNAYSLIAAYGAVTRTLNADLQYIYDGLYPTLTLRFLSQSDLYGNGDRSDTVSHTRRLSLSATLPLRLSTRRQWHWKNEIAFAKEGEREQGSNRGESWHSNGVRTSLIFNGAQQYYDSISPADGLRLTLTLERDAKILGGDLDLSVASGDMRGYFSLGYPSTLAWRLAVAQAWGDPGSAGSAGPPFAMGGAGSLESTVLDRSDIFGLQRGFPAGFFRGRGGWLLNVELRLALFKIEHSYSISSLERTYLSLYADIGNLWEKRAKLKPVVSPGVEASLVFNVLGIHLTGSAGVAVGFHHPHRQPIFYARLGRAF